MVFTPYKLSLPTTVEPAGGFTANNRIVFRLPVQPMTQTRKRSIRLNGILQLTKGDKLPVEASDELFLSPLSGVSGVIRQITSYGRSQKTGEIQLENIFEYGRWVGMKNEASHNTYWATSADSLLEVMNYENFNYQDGTAPDVKMAGCNLLFPPDAPYVDGETIIQQSEMPFSVDLDIAINSNDVPSSKFDELSISIVLQDVAKSGLVSRSGVPTTFNYALKNLEVRYMCDPETAKGPLFLEIKDNSFNGTVLNRISALEHSPALASFHSIACSFLKQGHDNENNNLIYDYLARECITEGVDYFELKINGASENSPLKYPLRFRQTEHAMNYILSLNNGKWSENSLSYPKMSGAVKIGYGLGAHLFQELSNVRVQFNLALLNAPAVDGAYRAFFFVVGTLQI